MKQLSEQAAAVCHCLLRQPETIDRIAQRALAGDKDAIEAVICLVWVMAGMVATLEKQLAFDTFGDAAPRDGLLSVSFVKSQVDDEQLTRAR